MPPKSLTSFIALALSTVPVAMPLASGTPEQFPLMMLWYVVIGIMGLISAAGTAIAWLDFKDRRAERTETRLDRKQAGGMGGYVTHNTMLRELAKVYDRVGAEDKALREDITGDLADIKTTLKTLTASVQAISNRHERLEGQLNPIKLSAPR